MPWTDEQLRNLPEHVRKLNPDLYADVHLSPTSSKPQPDSQPARPRAAPAPQGSVQSVRVRVQSYRCRPADPDNAFIKHHVDALRDHGILQDDTCAHVSIEILPDIKVTTRADERTEIELQ